jgi:hypothetical protein
MHTALKPRLLWLAVPIASPLLYTIYLYWTLSRDTESTSGPVDTSTLSNTRVPEEVPINDPNTLVFHETVSKAVSKDSLPKVFQSDLDALLTAYIRSNMTTFSHLPQAIMIRRLLSAPEDRATFESLHLDTISFVPGDCVCGVYLVKRRSRVLEWSCSWTRQSRTVALCSRASWSWVCRRRLGRSCLRTKCGCGGGE